MYEMSSQNTEFNGKFTKLQEWDLTEKTRLVMTEVLDQNTGDKRILFNKQWTKQDGKTGISKDGLTIPMSLKDQVAEAIKQYTA